MKQTIEIEVPDGKKVVWENNQIKFVDIEHWRYIKTFDDAYEYCSKVKGLATDLLYLYNSYLSIGYSDYEVNIVKLRIIVAALTNNEYMSLNEGNVWYPIVQFCFADKKDKCLGNNVIGKIKSNNKELLVVGGAATITPFFGLGCSDPYNALSHGYGAIGFIKVSSQEIAKHISTYFGKLIFDVMYGGCNCNYEWID